VVTVAVYSTTPFDMLAKVVDGGAAQIQLRKLVTTVVDGKHLVLILTLKDNTAAELIYKNTFLSFMEAWWWF
jgi:hypothetical protein